jgi:nondiscriminating aspartyl-tRNA synthetase
MNRTLAGQVGTYVGERVQVQGWLHALRKMGEVNFLIIRDRSGIIQAVASTDDLTPLQGLQSESIVSVTGTVVEAANAPGGYELYDNTIEVITSVEFPLPFTLNKNRVKANQPAFLDHAVIGHRHLGKRAILRLASGIMAGFRQTLNEHDFVEVQTPKLVASATESGANVFAVEYFGQTAYLAQSPQFYKQIMVGVFERVYEVGPVFRAEKHSTRRHINEYVSLDVEFGFIQNHFTVMEMLTTVICGILNHLEANCAAELKQLRTELPAVGETIPHLHMTEAQNLLTDRYGMTDAIGAPDLTPEHERLLGEWAREAHQSDFLFVTGYPMAKRPFYTHPDPERPQYSNSFDLLFRGTELVTGGQRLHLYADYLSAAKAYGYNPDDFETYLEAFKHGMPPHGGFAIGLERFLMQLLGLDNVRLATLFPRDINRLTP